MPPPNKVQPCLQPYCYTGWYAHHKATHDKECHRQPAPVAFVSKEGQTQYILRNSLTGLYDCPCGRSEHSRSHRGQFKKLLGHHTHPTNNPHPDKQRSDYPGDQSRLPPPFPPPQIRGPGLTADASVNMDGEGEDMDDEEGEGDGADSDIEQEPADDPPPAFVSPDFGFPEDAPDGNTEEPSPLPASEGVEQDLAVETDSDETEEEFFEEDTRMDTGEEDKESLEASRVFLLKHGLYVERHHRRIVCTSCGIIVSHVLCHKHCHDKHKSQYNHRTKHGARLPPKEEMEQHIAVLGGDRPVRFPRGPIPRIDGVRIYLDGIRCMIPGCQTVALSKRGIDKHFVKKHPEATQRPKERDVPIHRVVRLDGKEEGYVEVLSAAGEPSDTLAFVVAQAKARGLGVVSMQFQSAENVRYLDPLLAQGKWLELVADVSIGELRASAVAPIAQEGDLFKLPPLFREYYHGIAGTISQLSTLTLRAIHSQGPEIKNIPFHRPQEKETIDQDGNYMSYFVCFLLRHCTSPIRGFHVPLHDDLSDLLDRLLALISGEDIEKELILDAIHKTVWCILQKTSPEAKRNEKLDLFNLFLLASHIIDDEGHFSSVQRIPPDISKLQWCFRATAVEQVILLRGKYDDQDFEAYECEVKAFIIDGRPGLFTVLRQRMKYFSSLSLLQPGIPRLWWNYGETIVSIDGNPIPLSRLLHSVKDGIAELEAMLKKLLRGFDMTDVLSFITRRIDSSPEKSDQWFRDDPRERKNRYSFIEDPKNELKQYELILLNHFTNTQDFFFLKDGGIYPKPDKIQTWIQELDEIVRLVFFLMTTSSGGTPRGTECEGLRFANNSLGNRHVLFFNGMLGVVTSYSKTQGRSGHASAILRCPPSALGRLLVFLWSVVYPCAAHLMHMARPESDDAENYLSYMYVASGRVMNSKALGEALSLHSLTRLKLKMGHRDMRQLMDSVLKVTTGKNYGDGDDESRHISDIDSQTNHSTSIAQKHYSIDYGALNDLAHTVILMHQRVSLRWHCVLDLAPTHISTDIAKSSDVNPNASMLVLVEQVLPVFKHSMNEAYVTFGQGLRKEARQVMRELAESWMAYEREKEGGKLEDVAFPPVEVHPNLLKKLQGLHPELPDLQWNSVAQGEVLQLLVDGMTYHILLTCPTGSGKTSILVTGAKICPAKVLIAITPLVATTQDLYQRVLANGVNVCNWGEKFERGIDPNCSMVVISAHLVNSTEFRAYLECLGDRILAIAIDEAHEIPISSYRGTYEFFPHLTRLKKPFLFLSATVLPATEIRICEMLEIDPRMLRVFRLPTYRPNISYRVETVTDPSAGSARAGEIMRENALAKGEKGLIYCQTVAEVDAIATQYGTLKYHAKLDPISEARNKMLKESSHQVWQHSEAKEHQWMVCTLAFGLGIDHPRVRFCIHVGMPSLLRFVQESGRMGRNGCPSVSFVLDFKRYAFPASEEDKYMAREQAAGYIKTDRCRRLHLGVFDTEKHSCGAIPSVSFCDNCERRTGETSIRMVQPMSTNIAIVGNQPLTIETHGERLLAQTKAGTREIQRIEDIIQEVGKHACAVCWMASRTNPNFQTPPPHEMSEHTTHPRVPPTQKALRELKFPTYVHWPFCYKCWVPFDEPCNHPRYQRGPAVFKERCVENIILPHIVALIYGAGDSTTSFHYVLAQELGDADNMWNSIAGFRKWLSTPCQNASQIPNVFRFILAFDTIYPQR